MTLAYIYDRTRPLAERVQDAIDAIICERDWGNTTEAEEAALSEVIADIAAADRLARAVDVVADYKGMRMELTRRVDIGDTTTLVYDANAWYQTGEDYRSALDAYRARMAQGVGDA